MYHSFGPICEALLEIEMRSFPILKQAGPKVLGCTMKSSESWLIHKGRSGFQIRLSETLAYAGDQVYTVISVLLSSFREI